MDILEIYIKGQEHLVSELEFKNVSYGPYEWKLITIKRQMAEKSK